MHSDSCLALGTSNAQVAILGLRSLHREPHKWERGADDDGTEKRKHVGREMERLGINF